MNCGITFTDFFLSELITVSISVTDTDFNVFSGPQKGPAERSHVKKRQKSSKSIKNIFDTFRHFSRRAKNVKNRQKVSKHF